MARYKQMPGRTYHIVSQTSSSITVECTYMCPYCKNDTTAVFEAPSESMYLLERGGFFERLTCSNCGETANVRYFKANRI